jgi:hypothetical protein
MNEKDELVVFRTGSLVQLDMVTGELTTAGIPHFTREETSSGLRMAMPAAPSVGPGTWWTVIVPGKAAEDAHAVIATLPFDAKTNPDVWDFQPTQKVKLGWKLYAGGILLFLLISAIVELISKFK